MDEENKTPETSEPSPEKHKSSTPTYVRVLALLGALGVLGLSIAYAYSLATGGIFWM